MAYTNGELISFKKGWDEEIKKKAIDTLEDMLDNGLEAGKSILFSRKEYIEIYTICYLMCTQRAPYNWADELYQKHGETIKNYLIQTVLPALREKSGQGGPILLREFQYRWSNHQLMNKWLMKFFIYLDKYHVTHHTLPTLGQVGLKHFKTEVYEVIKADITTAILSLINQEREGEIIDKTLLKSNVAIYETIGMGKLNAYTNDLETPFLASTREYYAKKKDIWIVTDSTHDYLTKAEAILEAEKNRVTDYLNPASESKLLRVCEEEILGKVVMQLLEKEGFECSVLLADKSDDWKRMFRLFSRLEKGKNPMANIVKSFISSMGHEIINQRQASLDGGEKDRNDDPEFVRALLVLHKKCLGVVKQDFMGQALFHESLSDAFVDVVNKNVGMFTNAELLSTFCDRVLKSGGEKLNETEVDECLDNVVQLFSYLADKDLFADNYRNRLAKRLLHQRSAMNDAERSMLMKLKIQCGTHFTSKMEGMLNDLAVDVDQKKEFDQEIKEHKIKIDFSVQVLTTGFWPTYKSPAVALPSGMTDSVNIFNEWYNQKNSSRKLSWMFSLGTASVRATFGMKSYDLQVSTLQAVTLMALDRGQTMTFVELSQKLNLEETIMKPLMHSLSCGKFKVVTKSPAINKISSTDSFVANSRFSSSMRKIRIPVASLDMFHNTKQVKEDRSNAIEASIVRIMKARKTLKHQQLQAAVLSQLEFFRPNPRVIKKRIESLIEREYIERDSKNQSLYKYVA